MKSIMQSTKECFVTHSTANLHKHHIFYGSNRKKSEQYGCYVYLVPELHNMSDMGVHFNKGFDLWLKRLCQGEFEKTHTRQEFMKIFGKNYL